MSLRNIIRSDYAEYIGLNAHNYPRDLIDGLKTKERVPLFLDNMAKELAIAEGRQLVKLDRMKIKNMVYEMTRFFLTNLKRRADEMSLSDNERSRLVADEKKQHSISDEEATEYINELTKDKIIMVEDRE